MVSNSSLMCSSVRLSKRLSALTSRSYGCSNRRCAFEFPKKKKRGAHSISLSLIQRKENILLRLVTDGLPRCLCFDQMGQFPESLAINLERIRNPRIPAPPGLMILRLALPHISHACWWCCCCRWSLAASSYCFMSDLRKKKLGDLIFISAAPFHLYARGKTPASRSHRRK